MTPEELDALAEAERAFERAAGTRYGHSVYVTDETRDVVRRALRLMREQAEVVRERDRLAAWQDAVLDAVQADLEHGVRPLNEAAAKDFQKRFPNLCAALARAGGDDSAQEDTQ